MSFLGRQNPDKGIASKFDRQNRFSIKRKQSPVGLYEYILENQAGSESLTIPRHLFDRFRSTVCKLHDQINEDRLKSKDVDHKLYFKELECFRFHFSTQTVNNLVIQSLIGRGAVKVAKEAMPTLIELLFHEHLDHPSDTFDAIIDYHRLFQFTFAEGSTSITSGLVVRKDVLSENDSYVPTMNREARKNKVFYPGADMQDTGLQGLAPSSSSKEAKQGSFKSKLGHRDNDKNYSVDYESLFQGVNANPEISGDAAPVRSSYKKSLNTFPLPLLASDIKSWKAKSYKVELSQEDAVDFREKFLTDRSLDLFIGFEIIDAIHKVSGRMKTYRFPLYYMKVKVEESGRFLHITPPKNGDIYMNHIALISMVESFSKSKGEEPLSKFLNHMLAQKIEVNKELHPIKIHRQLPFSEDVFDQGRDILIGKPGEGGKGGILESLKVLGMECDLEAIILYKVEKNSSPTSVALDRDLYEIQERAHEQPSKFYGSLLGRFLVPERKDQKKSEKFSTMAMNPGFRARSMSRLMNNIDSHDLLLLEGPPGTGKTFTIMNLFIHCLNEGKRLLIVSDQKAAIHALTEKMEEYLVGKEYKTPEGQKTLALWKSAIRVADEIPTETDSLNSWVAKLIKMLNLEYCKEQDWPNENEKVVEQIKDIDKQFDKIRASIEHILSKRFGKESSSREVAPKYHHPTTETDIKDLVDFLHFIGAGEHSKIKQSDDYVNNQDLANRFISNREQMAKSHLAPCYDSFSIVISNLDKCLEFATQQKDLMSKLITLKPRKIEDLRAVFSDNDRSEMSRFLFEHWTKEFAPENGFLKKVTSKLGHPCMGTWNTLQSYLRDQENLLREVQAMERSEGIMRQLQDIHKSIDPDSESTHTSAALEICKLSQDQHEIMNSSVQKLLSQLNELQSKRDALVKEKFLSGLTQICKGAIAGQKNGTNLATSITNLLESLKDAKSIDHGSGVPILKELQEKLMEAFPIWICRKQNASFLFPCDTDSFDLVVVDEAGQCRVDDAIPLLYRAKKLMVVGDEKQTVLDKNSIIDDYLFGEFELEEQLRTTQARGVKGGGSNLFSLIKSVKQGGVMLDEHYRCPPDIIAYSNEYVYNSDLRIMQWTHPTASASVVVDYSEKKKSPSRKPTSGKYKSIEVDMIDRFFDYVVEQVKLIEKETGNKINMETDVALCYFLLKNEPYIKDKKSEFLQRLGRGNDVLDGAGAALQGKEREYIFYLWDVNRSNMTFFKQGDDPDKRKGELNVLMSRPKVRAYHFLHHGFDTLQHDGASITDYLWKTYQGQLAESVKESKTSRTKRPGTDYRPWQRSSGNTMLAILSHLFKTRDVPQVKSSKRSHTSVVVGDPKRKVDLMILSEPGTGSKSVGVVDLSGFENSQKLGEDVIDYFFQLKRVSPSMTPAFVFLHELADERSEGYQEIEAKVKTLLSNSVA